uniref:Natriuretic peptides A n=1 Tax=Sphenodon punctatus TaxID=8508 RepID=A0A8D0H646_SPHPU
MGSLTSVVLGLPLLLLCLFMKLQEQAKAHPVYSSLTTSELADFKNLLDNLEDKISSEDTEAGLSQGFSEQSEEAPGDALRPLASWDGEYVRPQKEGAFGRSSWEPPEKPPSSLKSKLQVLLNSPRSMRRSSDCFGQRIDRIGSKSGMGCNRNRVRTENSSTEQMWGGVGGGAVTRRERMK